MSLMITNTVSSKFLTHWTGTILSVWDLKDCLSLYFNVSLYTLYISFFLFFWMWNYQLGFELCRSIGMLTLPYLKLVDAYLLFGLLLLWFLRGFEFLGFFFCLGMWVKEELRVQKLMFDKVQNWCLNLKHTSPLPQHWLQKLPRADTTHEAPYGSASPNFSSA